jgi:hypothetical protein
VHGHLQTTSFVFTTDGVLKLTGAGEPRWLLLPASAEENEPTPQEDLRALGRIAAEWAALGPRRGNKAKPLPTTLQAVLDTLQAEDPNQGYATASELLEALDEAGSDIPPNATAWERFLREVRDQAASRALRRTA